MEDNLYSLLKQSAERNTQRTALEYGKIKLPYSKLILKTDSFAEALKRSGVKHSDNVAVLLKNSPEFIIAAFACFKIGAVLVPVNFYLTAGEIIYILNDARVKVLITSADFESYFSRIREEVNDFREIIIAGNTDEEEFYDSDGDEVLREDSAAIFYTSGTTGHPKGAVLTHGNFISNVESCLKVVNISKHDRTLCFLPLFHSFAFTANLLLPLFSGGCVVLLDRLMRGSRFLSLIFFRRITIFVSIPQVYRLFLKVPKLLGRLALLRIRYFISGADCLSEKTLIAFEKKFGKTILEGYGLTEAAPVVTLNPPGKRKPGSIGKPLPDVEVKVIGEDGEEKERGEIGELIVRGGNVMKGYLGLTEATAAVLKGGWLYTGDMGFMTEDGYLTIAERKNDMFVCRGFNVYPREIENVLRDIPQVEETAVVGYKLKEETEVPVAFIKTAGSISESDIVAYCRKRLANYKVPKKIFFVNDFPRNSTGKILKKELRAQLQEFYLALPPFE